MPDKLIQKLLKENKLKKQEAGIIQIEQLLISSMHNLTQASKIQEIVEEATYIMAYNAMLKAGRALLLFKGYVPDDGAQHRTVVEVTTSILGQKFEKVTAHFERMRKKRNLLTYESGAFVTFTESNQAFHDAIDLVQGILNEVKAKNPQLELKFKI
ncbi:MAG: hypothetical protein A2252_02910 [Elusimicrobia bacterium RIFOXYA2_FULL_39_19]|nr:MAG: hypothetical protein A2252_02910 [Elusimicrobia bacterium RIFOXYA2_FULL_39_19]